MANPTENNQCNTEIWRSEDNNIEIEETQKLFNKHRNKFLKKERRRIRRKIYVKETIRKYLKEFEEKGSLTRQEKKDKKHYTKILQRAEKYFKMLKEDLSKIKEQRHNISDTEYRGNRRNKIVI